MNDEPKRILVGTIPSGVGAVLAFEDIGSPLVAEANRKADAERAERERVARASITVNRGWLLSVLRDSIARTESDLADAIRAGDYHRRCLVARRVNRLRADYEFCDAREPPPWASSSPRRRTTCDRSSRASSPLRPLRPKQSRN